MLLRIPGKKDKKIEAGSETERAADKAS